MRVKTTAERRMFKTLSGTEATAFGGGMECPPDDLVFPEHAAKVLGLSVGVMLNALNQAGVRRYFRAVRLSEAAAAANSYVPGRRVYKAIRLSNKMIRRGPRPEHWHEWWSRFDDIARAVEDYRDYSNENGGA